MKTLLTFSLAFFLAGFTVSAQDVDGPVMTFETETIDYGTIEQNSDGHREFKFTNTGTQSLLIEKCQGTCGCTVPECPKEVVQPGESSTIQVKYATNRLGSFSKGVKVYSNATDDGVPKTVYIKGNVLTPEQYANQVKSAEPEKAGKKEKKSE